MIKRKILLLGVNGFIGGNLLKFLCDKYIVFSASVRTPYDNLDNLVFNSDIIIHTIGVTRSQEEIDFFKINIDFSHQIYNIICKSEGIKLIFLSSIHPQLLCFELNKKIFIL